MNAEIVRVPPRLPDPRHRSKKAKRRPADLTAARQANRWARKMTKRLNRTQH